MKIRMVVTPDYYAWPIWPGGEAFEHIDPEALPSAELHDAFQRWADEWTQVNEVADSTPRDELEAANERLAQAGWDLATRLAAELGDGYEIFYFDSITGQNVPIPRPNG